MLRLLVGSSTDGSWIDTKSWDANATSLDDSGILEKRCYGAIATDGADRPLAFAIVFPFYQPSGGPVYRLKVRVWCPTDAGEVLDRDGIRDAIVADATRYRIESIAYDPFDCVRIANQLAGAGLNVHRLACSFGNLDEPSRAFERAVIAGRLLHNGNPVLRWMASNTVVISNGDGLVMPSRKKSRGPLSGIMATVMAVGCHGAVDF
jgi:phage terminase large subunit-like protein